MILLSHLIKSCNFTTNKKIFFFFFFSPPVTQRKPIAVTASKKVPHLSGLLQLNVKSCLLFMATTIYLPIMSIKNCCLFPGLWGAPFGGCRRDRRYFWILPDACGLRPSVWTHFLKRALCHTCPVVRRRLNKDCHPAKYIATKGKPIHCIV